MRKSLVALLILAGGLLTACSLEPATSAKTPSVVQPAPVADDLAESSPTRGYPLTTCLVDGEKLDPDRMAFRYKGQEVQFCCSRCVNDFRQDPQKYLARMAKAR